MEIRIKPVKIKVNMSNIQKVYPELENLEITPSNEEQIFQSNKYGYDVVTVKGIETEEVIIKPSKEEQIKDGLYNKVTILGDENLVAENIKEGIEIFDVVGNAKLAGEENAIMDGTALLKRTATNNDNVLGQLLKEIPYIETSDWTSTAYMFNMCVELERIPLLNTSKVINMSNMFNNCKKLKRIPLLNTSKVTNMSFMFRNCEGLEEVPLLDTSEVTTLESMLNRCESLKTIPLLDTSNATTMTDFLLGCTSLERIPILNTSKVTSMYDMFYECSELLEFPELDTNKVSNTGNMFYNCKKLTTVAEIEASLNTRISSMFYGCIALENFKGLKNIGKAFTQKTNNYNNYKFSLKSCDKLTYKSLINIINNLYDLNVTYGVANGGTLYTQNLDIGNSNLAKLTEEEIAIATSKGWNVS